MIRCLPGAKKRHALPASRNGRPHELIRPCSQLGCVYGCVRGRDSATCVVRGPLLCAVCNISGKINSG